MRFSTSCSRGPRLHPSLSPANVIISLAIVLVVSAISSIYPGLLAMRVSPRQAMQSGRLAMGFLLDFRIRFSQPVPARPPHLLLASAIAGVTALLILLNALSTGVSETMIRAATTLSTGHVNVGAFSK